MMGPEILTRHLPAPAPDTCIFLCGQPPMVDPLEAVLKGRGYSRQAIILPLRNLLVLILVGIRLF